MAFLLKSPGIVLRTPKIFHDFKFSIFSALLCCCYELISLLSPSILRLSKNSLHYFTPSPPLPPFFHLILCAKFHFLANSQPAKVLFKCIHRLFIHLPNIFVTVFYPGFTYRVLFETENFPVSKCRRKISSLEKHHRSPTQHMLHLTQKHLIFVVHHLQKKTAAHFNGIWLLLIKLMLIKPNGTKFFWSLFFVVAVGINVQSFPFILISFFKFQSLCCTLVKLFHQIIVYQRAQKLLIKFL